MSSYKVWITIVIDVLKAIIKKYLQLTSYAPLFHSLHVTNFRKIRSSAVTFSDFSSRSQWHLADTSPITSENWQIMQEYFMLVKLFVFTESFSFHNFDSFRLLIRKLRDSFDFAPKISCGVLVTRALIGSKNTTRICRSNQLCFYIY